MPPTSVSLAGWELTGQVHHLSTPSCGLLACAIYVDTRGCALSVAITQRFPLLRPCLPSHQPVLHPPACTPLIPPTNPLKTAHSVSLSDATGVYEKGTRNVATSDYTKLSYTMSGLKVGASMQ